MTIQTYGFKDKPDDNKAKANLYLFLRKLGVQQCKKTLFIANDYSFYSFIEGM